MYIRDLGVAHIDALYGDDRAVVEVATGALLAETLKPRQADLVREWVELHRSELVETWQRASAGEPPIRLSHSMNFETQGFFLRVE
jgi:hypothetical protein